MNEIVLFFAENLPLFWLAVMIFCLIVEGLSQALTTIWFACGSLVMIFISFLPISFIWQLLVFMILSSLLLVFTRPFAVKKLHVKATPLNSDSLAGQKAVVVKDISEFNRGEIKINGVIWTAKSEDGSSLSEGQKCIIAGIEGATAIVKPDSENN